MDRPLRLALLRHAKSDWSEPELPDHARPLSARGRRDAPRVAASLTRHNWTFGVVLCSTATRARQTLDALGLGGEVTQILSDRLYMGGIDALQAELSEIAPAVDSVLAIGHNPGWEEALAWLCGAPQALKTADLALLQGPRPWSALRPGSWTLAALIRARDLR